MAICYFFPVVPGAFLGGKRGQGLQLGSATVLPAGYYPGLGLAWLGWLGLGVGGFS